MGELVVFYSLALLITMCSVMVTCARNPVTAAVFLVIDLFLIAGIYALQGAHFIAAVQVIVYAGAILVLFLFVIMLLNLSPDQLQGSKKGAFEYLFMGLTSMAFIAVGVMLLLSGPTALENPDQLPLGGSNTVNLGMRLFSKYLWPFELASILILLAIVASILIAKKDHIKAKKV
jgi:NADH-quinone oxidoreductase subunit J